MSVRADPAASMLPVPRGQEPLRRPGGAQFDPAIDHADHQRFAELEAAYPGERELLLVAEETGSVVGAAMGFTSPWPEVTLRILAVVADRRRRGIGRALLRGFEAAALRLGATRVSLGADAEAGFCIRHGYQTMLLLQWAYDRRCRWRRRQLATMSLA